MEMYLNWHLWTLQTRCVVFSSYRNVFNYFFWRLEELREAVVSTEKREKEKSDKYLNALREGEKALEEKTTHLARTRNELHSQSVEYLNLSNRIARARVEQRDLENEAAGKKEEIAEMASKQEDERLAHDKMIKVLAYFSL